MRSLLSATTVAAVAVTLVQFAAPTADAQRRHGADRGYGHVTADSRYSSASITAPVRYGRHGRPEVRLPGGTWIECRRSCRNTLRQETIDFWSSRDTHDGVPDDGPGYFQFRF